MNFGKHTEVWNDCLKIIANNVDPQQYDTWFAPIKPISLVDMTLTLEAPSQFFCEYIEANYLNLLYKTIVRVLGPNAHIYYQFPVVKSQPPMRVPGVESLPPTNQSVTVPTMSGAEGPSAFVIPGVQAPLRINPNLNPVYCFANLVEGACNKLGVAAGKDIANTPGKTYNPMFLFGGPGLGKTHVAQAIGLEIKKKFPNLIVLYVPASRFKAQFQKAMSAKNQFADFLAFYQKIDVLIMDDIQDISSPGTQNAFFQIFNYLHQNNKQLIFTSDRRQVDLQNFEQRLLNRLKWGLSAELLPPDYATRLNMLKLRSLREGVTIPDEILEYLAGRIKSNFRELEGALISLIAQTTFLKEEPSIEMARRITDNIVDEATVELSLDKVQDAVCAYFNITRDQMLSPSRKRQIVQARQIAMYLSRNLTNSSLSTIGEVIGGKDHATVLHACNTVTDLMATDRLFKQYVLDIQKNLTVA